MSILSTATIGADSRIPAQHSDGENFVLYPNEARARGLTYSRKIFAKIKHEIYEVDSAGGKTLKQRGTDNGMEMTDHIKTLFHLSL